MSFFGGKKPPEATHENLKQGLGAAARPEKAAARPPPPRRPGGQNPGFSKNARGASGGLRGLPLSPPVPPEGPLGPQRAQKCPGGLMGPLGPPWAPAALRDLREAHCTLVLLRYGGDAYVNVPYYGELYARFTALWGKIFSARLQML